MQAYDIIAKKRDRLELSRNEIHFIIDGFVKGDIPDYQMSAWLMAGYLNGFTDRETSWLTSEMVSSGDVVDLSSIPGAKVDKHSTGGVGDKTTLVIVPLAAACGLKIAKMSGRGLGHTGGTLDKLESIPGMRVDLSKDEMVEQVRRIGAVITGQTAELVPADKKLYALRDVTATVDSIPLIASSVMSKKIAAGADVILVDVKVGNGAFMKNVERARKLARMMIRIGRDAGKKVVCVLSDMDQPLGRAIGNSLEIAEAVDALANRGAIDLAELCIKLTAILIYSSGNAKTIDEAETVARDAMVCGEGLRKFKEIIKAQSGDERIVDDTSLLPEAELKIDVPSPQDGYITGIDAYITGRIAMLAGAGRITKDTKIDPAAGITLNKKVGDPVKLGETLAVIHCSKNIDPTAVMSRLLKAYRFSTTAPKKKSELFEIIGLED